MMKRWQYFTAPLVLILLIATGLHVTKKFYPNSWAVSVPITFSDGQILTAAQLNTTVTTIYSAFNGHDHDGSDGEPSTISPSVIDTDFSMVTGGITNLDTIDSTSGTDLTINASAQNVIVGGYSHSNETRLGILNSSSNSVLRLDTDSGSAIWDIQNNHTTNDLEFEYNTSTAEIAFTNEGGIYTNGHSSSDIAWETYTGTTCSSDPCTTTVDASAPGSGAPISFQCCIAGDDDDYHCNSVPTGGAAFNLEYDTSADDLLIVIPSGTLDNHTYNCIVMYQP